MDSLQVAAQISNKLTPIEVGLTQVAIAGVFEQSVTAHTFLVAVPCTSFHVEASECCVTY